MARIITKQLAEVIVRKLQGRKLNSRNKAHDEFAIEHEGIHLGIIRIRRGSDRDLGHDFIPGALGISPHLAREIGRCSKDRDDFIAALRERGLLQAEESAEEATDEGETTE